MSKIKPNIEEGWLEVLRPEFNKPYFTELKKFLKQQKATHTIYPPSAKIFSAFNTTAFADAKVVIIGQDPYHGHGQANGLSFSVERNIKIPPSLKNIYKELHSDLGMPIPNHGDLTQWAEQGVLLLNAVLTVNQKSPGSHRQQGWELFTDAAIKALSEQRENLVFFLWGKYAQNKASFIDRKKHLVIESAHPSPFSAHNGFFGSKPFSQANTYLQQNGKKPIEWALD